MRSLSNKGPAKQKNRAFNKSRKVVCTAISLLLFGFLTFMGCSLLDFGALLGTTETPNADPGPGEYVGLVTLAAPANLSYDPDASTLSWTSVENALSYQVDYNGVIYETSEPALVVSLIATDNVFKVKAIGDTEYYSDSSWSAPFTHTLEQASLSVYEKVNLKIGEAAAEDKYELSKIIGISSTILEGNKYGDNIQISVLCRYNGKNWLVTMGFKCPTGDTIAEMLDHFEDAEYTGCTKEEVVLGYNSPEYLLGSLTSSKAYSGELYQFVSSGYTVTPLAYAVTKGEEIKTTPRKHRFNLVCTYKAERDGEVKYFTVTNRITILQKSSEYGYNYEGFLASEKYRTVEEIGFLLHEESTTLSYMQDLCAAYDNQ